MVSVPPTIITKVLLPNRRPSLLHRARLVDFIHDHIERRVILVSAGAGYGKTTLLTDYVHDTDLPVCWLSLDEGDRDLSLFVEYLVRAIQHRFPAFGQETLDLLRAAGTAPDSRALVAALCADMYQKIPGYFVLILDDYHVMDDSLAVNAFVDLLLRHLPENCHVILSSRTLPTKLTLTRLVARQEIAGLGVSDLRFTADEIKALLRQNYDQEVTDTQAEELAQRSEGWITGILLTTHDLWSGLFRNMIQVQGDEGQVFDYLAQEVFALQPSEVKEFLISSSVLSRMSPDLCNELLGIGNASDVLRTLESRNLFTFQLEGNWYRYHQLFREFLVTKGETEKPEAYRVLRGRGAELLATRGMVTEAISLFLAGEFWDRAAQVMDRAARSAWEKGQWTTLSTWIDALPPHLLPSHPWLPLFQGKIHLEGGDYTAAQESFGLAKVSFAEKQDSVGLAHTLIEEGIVWQSSGRYDRTIQNAQEALDLLNGDANSVIAGRAHRWLGTAHAMLGEPEEAIAELSQALSIYERLDRAYDIALVHHDLGLTHERLGNLSRSKMHLQQALKYWERVNNVPGMANTLNSLGVIQHSEGDYAEALETLEQALHHIRQAGVPLTEAYILASLGDLYRELGDPQQALSVYEQALEIGKRHDLSFVTLYALLAMGNIYSLQDKLDAASYYIDQAAAIADRSNSRYNQGLYSIASGVHLYQRGDLSSSQAELEEAIQSFGASGAKIELVRAHLYLAEVRLASGSISEANRCLNDIVDLARDLDYQQFIVAEARNLPRLIQHGAQQGIGGSFFQEIATKLQKLLRLSSSSLRKEHLGVFATAIVALEARALGDSHVVKDGEIISNADWGASVAKELFFYLLDHPEGLRKDEIIDSFWHDTPQSRGNSNFHSTTYRIRRAVYPECLVRENGLYRLVLDIPHTYDVADFERLIQATASDPRSPEATLRQAIALYRGDYMADVYADWCLERREQLRKKYATALQTLADYYCERGRYAESIPYLEKAVGLDPFGERLYRQLMEAHSRLGDRAGVVKCYQECVHTLEQELGVEPSQETQDLYKRILNLGS